MPCRTVQVGMMFVRCRGGVSHSPLEHVEEGDVAVATAALSLYLDRRLPAGGGDGAAAPATSDHSEL